MKISLDQLHNQSIQPFYLLSGDETLLIDEACELILQKIPQEAEVRRLQLGAGFNWEQFYTPSLFQPITCFVLTLSQKLDNNTRESLIHLATHPHAQRYIILKFPKVETETLKSKWFDTLSNACTWLPITPIYPTALPQWIQQRAQSRFQLSLTVEQARFIAEKTENNLLASDQALQKLQLIAQPITLALLKELIVSEAQYDIFGLSDACLAGQAARIPQMLETLRAQDVAQTLIVWSLAKEMRSLIQLHAAIKKGQSMSQACQQQRVWSSRIALIQKILARSKQEDCLYLLDKLAYVDGIIKGVHSGDSWHELHKICIAIANLPQQSYRHFWGNV